MHKSAAPTETAFPASKMGSDRVRHTTMATSDQQTYINFTPSLDEVGQFLPCIIIGVCCGLRGGHLCFRRNAGARDGLQNKNRFTITPIPGLFLFWTVIAIVTPSDMDAGEDLAANLKNYEIQLQQVLAALETDAENAEMLQLKIDLEEVIKLTKDLMGPSLPSTGRSSGHSTSNRVAYRAGDRVQAPYSEDGLYYEAVVDDITSDGQCTVVFSNDVLGRGDSSDGKHRKWSKGVSEVCLVSLLKPSQLDNSSYKKPSHKPANANGNSDKKPLSKEALKRKRQKREEKLKDFEQEREKDKMKWQQFAMGKKAGKKKGLASAAGGKKTSIFATPESVDGRVGIGTCGISGMMRRHCLFVLNA